jgi:IclR family acetate operon transcriptional repressor
MSVPAAARVLDLIEVFAKYRHPMTVTTLAQRLGLPVSSCHGMVKTLQARGYLLHLKEQGGYYFSKRLEQHAAGIAGYDPLPAWVRPALAAVRDAAGETTLLAKLSGCSAVYVEVLESVQSVGYIAQVGDLRPLYASAAGKALLGGMPAARKKELLDEIPLQKRNRHTLRTREALERDLALSSRRGWYLSRGEFLPDVTAVATHLLLNDELYAVVIAGPSQRVGRQLARLASLVAGFIARANSMQ